MSIDASRASRSAAIAAMPARVLAAWKYPEAIKLRDGASVAGILRRGGAPARRVFAEAERLAAGGGAQTPEATLLAAAKPRSPDKQGRPTTRLLASKTRQAVGQVRYSLQPGQPLYLRLSAQVDQQTKELVLKVLADAGIVIRAPKG